MVRVRWGRVVGVATIAWFLLNPVEWGSARSDPEESAQGHVRRSGAARERAQVEAPTVRLVGNPLWRLRDAHRNAANWSWRLARLTEVLQGCSRVTVHRMNAWEDGSLQLVCSAQDDLREVAEFRTALKASPLAHDRKLLGASVTRLASSGACLVHGDGAGYLQFEVTLSVTVPDPEVEFVAGSVDLIGPCWDQRENGDSVDWPDPLSVSLPR